MNWYDRAVDQLEKDLSSGAISDEEYWQQVRELNAELRECAQEAADQAYNDTMGW